MVHRQTDGHRAVAAVAVREILRERVAFVKHLPSPHILIACGHIQLHGVGIDHLHGKRHRTIAAQRRRVCKHQRVSMIERYPMPTDGQVPRTDRSVIADLRRRQHGRMHEKHAVAALRVFQSFRIVSARGVNIPIPLKLIAHNSVK